MKLIIKQYLASLKERGELDVILPDLLSQLGLNVFSRPHRGTKQYGVDVAAVGSLNDGPEKVYLFSIKAGDITRSSWSGSSNQDLRPSLIQIKDVYIPTHLPNEHKNKDIVICLCFGGDIREDVTLDIHSYINQNTTPILAFECWNGDKLADLILSSFFREELLPINVRSELRKALAFLDEPEVSHKHFTVLIKSLYKMASDKLPKRLIAIRQVYICLWILFAWARDAGNIESAYLSSELALLYVWDIAKQHSTEKTKNANDVQLIFNALLALYLQIGYQYLAENIMPHTNKKHGLSTAVYAACELDINLKLFDILGRLAIRGLWSYWAIQRLDNDAEIKKTTNEKLMNFTLKLKELISNNPTLLLPFKDDQTIDISLALLFLALDSNNHQDIKGWLSEMMERAILAYKMHGHYPCILQSYSELLEHPRMQNDGYRQDVTRGSILYPTIALWALIIKDVSLYENVKSAKEKYFKHCDFQLWYPDDTSENHIYINSDFHGGTLSSPPIEKSEDFLTQIFGECEHSNFNKLSAISWGLWPIILVTCRHYRIPVPVEFLIFLGLYPNKPVTYKEKINNLAEIV